MVDDLSVNFVYCGNEFPGDDLQRSFESLQRHARNHQFPRLARFLTRSTSMLKQQVALLPRHLQEGLPGFENVLSLVTYYVGHRRCPTAGALDGALLCIMQIALLVG
jgi:hypothetical protein